MIELDIKDYCQNCPNFMAHVERLYRDDDCVMTSITCEYREHCERIRKHIEKGLKDEEKD